MKRMDGLYYDMSQYELAENKIMSEFLNVKNSLQTSTPKGKIGICFFDKMRFDKDLKRVLKKKYGVAIRTEKIWRKIWEESELYTQLEFLENAYGYKFKSRGEFNNYGLVVFYANNIENNPDAGIELLTSWFYNVLIPNYKKAVKKYNRIFPIYKDEFVFNQIWGPILRAAIHFDKSITRENAAKYMLELSKKEKMKVKIIDDYQIIYN